MNLGPTDPETEEEVESLSWFRSVEQTPVNPEIPFRHPIFSEGLSPKNMTFFVGKLNHAPHPGPPICCVWGRVNNERVSVRGVEIESEVICYSVSTPVYFRDTVARGGGGDSLGALKGMSQTPPPPRDVWTAMSPFKSLMEEGAGRPCVLSRPFILFFCQFILLIRICQFFTP